METEVFDAEYLTDDERAKIVALNADDVLVDWLAGISPLQATGNIDGYPFYFKARGIRWQIGIAPSAMDDPLDAFERVMQGAVNWWYYDEPYGKEYGDAGYMPMGEALTFIEWSARQHRQWRGVTK